MQCWRLCPSLLAPPSVALGFSANPFSLRSTITKLLLSHLMLWKGRYRFFFFFFYDLLSPSVCLVCPDQHGTAISTCCVLCRLHACTVLRFSRNSFLAATLPTSESTLLWPSVCVWVEWKELLAEIFRKVVKRVLLWESGLGPTRLLIRFLV